MNKKMVTGLLLVFIISFLIGFTNAIKKRVEIKQEKVVVEAQYTFRQQTNRQTTEVRLSITSRDRLN